MMDDGARESLQDRLRTIETAAAPFQEGLQKLHESGAPLRAALDAIVGARAALIEGLGVEVAGECSGCQRLLLAGDLGFQAYHDEPSVMYCEACAPTWGDIQAALPANPADDDVAQAEVINGLAEGLYGLHEKPLFPLEAEVL